MIEEIFYQRNIESLLAQSLALITRPPAEARLKLSQFNVIVPQEGYFLIFNTLTGVFLRVNGAPIGNWYNDTAADDLYRLGVIVNESLDESKFYQELQTVIHRQQSASNEIVRFNILVTTGCNARCFYCFEENISVKSMTSEMALHVAHYIAEKGTKKHPVQLRWFGGEPTVNLMAIRTICKELRKRCVLYSSTMSSNGYLLVPDIADEMRDLWNIVEVRIALDGYENEHNRRKAFVNASNAFQQTINNIENLVNKGIIVEIRLTMDLDNAESITRLAHHLIDKFRGSSYVKVYSRIIFQETTCNAKNSRPDRLAETLQWQKQIDKLLTEAGMYPINRYRPIGYQTYFCAANNPHKVVIMPDGSLCRCETVTEHTKIYGNVIDGITDQSEFERWVTYTEPREKCKHCPYLPSCTSFSLCPKDYYDCQALVSHCYASFMSSMYNSIQK